MKLTAPVASDPPEDSADWMEFEALRSKERQTSLATLARLLRQTGSTDAVEGVRGDAGSELSQSIAQDAFMEVENRSQACGPENYPFTIERGLLRLKDDAERSPYILLLLMSAITPTSGHGGTATLFERVCTQAALGYLGGSVNGAHAIRFGSPRRVPLAKFNQALDDLCLSLAEGGGCRIAGEAKHTGDEGLDIVAWRKFPDQREGKLIAFGQCAGGNDWANKLAELDAPKFMQKWLRAMLVVEPIRLFFVPRRISRDAWKHAGIDGGILFDRCRSIACLNELQEEFSQQCEKAITTLLQKLQST